MKMPLSIVSSIAVLLLVGCDASGDKNQTNHVASKTASHEMNHEQVSSNKAADMNSQFHLFDTFWQTKAITDSQDQDVSAMNPDFVYLSRYSALGHYELFDVKTGKSLGDYGYYWLTKDHQKQIMISTSNNRASIVHLKSLTPNQALYQSVGLSNTKTPVNLSIAHQPYFGKFKLEFSPFEDFNHQTGPMINTEDGVDLIANSLWQGVAVKDEQGHKVTQDYPSLLHLARYDALTNRYEYFDSKTGHSIGDYGYFGIIDNNKLQVSVSQGTGKYSLLELTEFNPKKITYRQQQKDSQGKNIWVYVDYIPYTGDFELKMTHTSH